MPCRGRSRDLLRPHSLAGAHSLEQDFSLSHNQGTVTCTESTTIGKGLQARCLMATGPLQARGGHNHSPISNLELLLTQLVERLGVLGDLVSLKKSLDPNYLLSEGLGENKKLRRRNCRDEKENSRRSRRGKVRGL